MRVEYVKSEGNPFGQFVIYAENQLERTVLYNFLNADRDRWQFWLHGGTYNCDFNDYTAFNFGWIKKKEE